MVLPIVPVEPNKTSFDTAEEMLVKLTGINKNWAIIKLVNVYDDPQNKENEERVLEVVWHTMIPEQVKILDSNYSWFGLLDLNSEKVNERHLKYIKDAGVVVL